MKNLTAILVLFVLLMGTVSCDPERWFEGPNTYAEGFETYAAEENLFDEGRWTHSQLTVEGNQIELDTQIVHSGQYALRFDGLASTPALLSKCSIVKGDMAFWEGQTVHIQFWVYLKGEAKANWVFLFDLEEKVAIGAGPGIRLANVGVENQLVIEHKYPNPNLHQEAATALALPRNQWVKLQLEVLLSQKKAGAIKVWQDEQLILAQDKWKTLPKDLIYAQQGTKGMYTNIEFGITANSEDSDLTVYVDDIFVETKD